MCTEEVGTLCLYPDVLQLEGRDFISFVPLLSCVGGHSWGQKQVPMLIFDLLSWLGEEGGKRTDILLLIES